MLRGKSLSSRAKQIVSSVCDYFEEEKNFNKTIVDIKQVVKRTAAATNLSEATIKRIRKEKRKIDEEGGSFSSPQKKPKKTPRIEFDDFDKAVLRRKIQEFYVEKKQVPTLKSLLHEMKQATGFEGQKDFLRKQLKEMGFAFRRCQTNRCVLIEKPAIVAARRRYLRAVKKARNSGRRIIFLDETYIHTTTTVEKCWQSKEEKGILKNCSKGSRFIIVHAGDEQGFVEHAGLVFKSGMKSGDYHHDMNSENFEKWLKEKFIPHIPRDSTIVMDNAPYHNVQVSKIPNTSFKKCDIEDWLREKGIPFEDKMLKAELLELVKESHPQKLFKADMLLKEHGCEVIRLPPYHPDLNPIEMIWKQVKDCVKKENVSSLAEEKLLDLCEKAFSEIGQESWSSVCRHVIEIENSYWRNDGIIEEEVERMNIAIGSEDDDSEDDDSEDNDSDDD